MESEVEATFYVTWRAHGEKRTVCLHTMDLEEARERAANIVGRVQWSDYDRYLGALVELGRSAEGELKRRSRGEAGVRLVSAWDRYVESRRRPQSSEAQLAQYRGQWDAFRAWAPQDVRALDDVSGGVAEQYVRHLEGTSLTARTANNHLQTLRRLWRVVDADLPNVWDGLRLSAGAREDGDGRGERGYRPLTWEEARGCMVAVRAALGDEFADLLLLCYWTGLRRKDAALLKMEDVWLGDQVLRVPPPHKTRGRGRGPLFIPVFGELEGMLRARREGAAAGAWLLGVVAGAQLAGRAAINKALPAVMRRVASSNDEGVVAFHSLRATFITMMDLAGAPHRVTDRITAHAPGSIRDRYSKPDVEAARRWMQKALRPLGWGE